MVTRIADLVRARKRLAAGVGVTTIEQRVLPFVPIDVQIPARVGTAGPEKPRSVTDTPDCLTSWWIAADYVWGLSTISWPSPSTITSSDGVWKIPTAAQKYLWLSVQGSAPYVRMAFASPTSPADNSAYGVYKIIYEPDYSARQWHPKQIVRFRDPGLVGVAQRLKSISLRQGAYNFSWVFANDGDATYTYSTETCLNRPLTEYGLGNRVLIGSNYPDNAYLNFRHVRQFVLSNGSKQGVIYNWSGHQSQNGFLPAIDDAEFTFFTGPESGGYTDLTNASDMSRLLIAGQAYHGRCVQNGVINDASTLMTVTSYIAPTSGATRYFKSPYAPGPPDESELPAGFTSSGKSFKSDVVLKNGTDYAPGSVAGALTLSQWLHVDDAGVVRVLGIARVSGTNSTTTFEIRNYGPVRITNSYDPYTYTVIAPAVTLTTTDSYANAITRDSKHVDTYTGGPDYQTWSAQWGSSPQSGGNRDATGYATGWPGVKLNSTIAVEASPNGRQIAIMRGIFNLHDRYTFWNGEKYTQAILPGVILTVATIDIASNLSVGSPNVVFQWQYHYPTNYSATANAHDRQLYQSLGTWWFQYSFSGVASSGDQYTLRECVGFSYKKDGTLKLATVEHDYGPTSLLGLSPNETVIWDSGIPIASPAPTVGPYDGGSISVSSYSINGGFGWHELAARASDYPSPPNRADYYLISGYRTTNNTIWYTTYYWPYGGGVTVADQDIVATESRVAIGSILSASPSYNQYVSYNPRTLEIGGSNNGTGPISFI